MKSVLRYTAAGLALATVGFASNASAATASATAEAEILQSLTVTLDASDDVLDFGTIALNGVTGGTVAVTPANVRTCAATLTCVGTTATPNFDIQGSANRPVAISFGSPTITLVGPAAATMSVALTSSSAALTLGGTGAGTFDVGGTLTVGNNQAAGVYTGTVNVVVIYS
jgi:Mat/Ecp fimbriae major subunit